MGVLHRAHIEGVEIRRTLSVIVNSNRYRSKAAEAFIQEILPQFASEDYAPHLEQLSSDSKTFLDKQVEISDS